MIKSQLFSFFFLDASVLWFSATVRADTKSESELNDAPSTTR